MEGFVWFLAYYSLIGIDGNFGWLLHATGVQGAALALGFSFNKDVYTMNAKAFKTVLATFYASSATIQAAGFEISPTREWIVRPFFFDEALAPLNAALDDLFKVHQEFDAFVSQLGPLNK